MKLTCHTRGNAAPQGKPRVYFTGHPADLEPYSKDIFSDILSTQNCAIYYDEEPDAPFDREELLRTLETMQLIVIPVTSRFLYVPNRARELEFPFAVERHIPVLPLMQEQGQEAAFNEKCGDLQLLSKQDKNPAVIPYPEKLQRFLDSVLMGDSLAARVRAAFQAYIFLSYRKKDRKYAHELMKLIHQNEFCRDVAIWYDEFLTPGENFTDSIRKAMDKSSLMVMAITPNMVNEHNYVIEHEYPDARRANKPILPVEVAPTDREALAASFPGIPGAVPAGDRAALAEGLRAGLRGVSARPHTPEQDYLIGLAYLNGIDVEVDKERAAALITGAAEAGLHEAMERLVDMYQRGNGVPRSHPTAIQWQGRLADWRRAQFERDETQENALLWALALCSLGKCQEELGDLPAAAGTYTRLTEISGQFVDRYGSMGLLSCLRFGYERMEYVATRENRPEEGESYCLRELDVIRRLSEAEGYESTQEYQTVSRYIAPQRDAADCYVQMGVTNKFQGKPDKARKYLLKGLEASQGACEGGSSQARRRVAVAYTNLGDLSQGKSPDEARDHYSKALEILWQLYEETGTAEAKRDLAVVYNNLARVASDADETRGSMLKSLGLLRELYEETGTIEAQERLVTAYANMGQVCRVSGGLDDTEEYYRQGLELSERLSQEIKTVPVRTTLAFFAQCMSILSWDLGRLRQSEQYCLQALALNQQLYQEGRTIEAQERLTRSYYCLGDVLQAQDRLEEAEDAYRKGIEIGKGLRENARSIFSLTSLGGCYQSLANTLERSGRTDEAEQLQLQALELLKQVSELPAYQYAVASSYYGLSRVCKDRGKAKEYCLWGLELCERGESTPSQFGCSLGHRHLAAILAEEGEPRRAVEHYETALRMAEKIPPIRIYEDEVAKNAFEIGLLARWDPALQKEMLTRAYDVWARLSERCPEVPEYARQRGRARAELDRLGCQRRES